jgi:hypothetical protein
MRYDMISFHASSDNTLSFDNITQTPVRCQQIKVLEIKILFLPFCILLL